MLIKYIFLAIGLSYPHQLAYVQVWTQLQNSRLAISRSYSHKPKIQKIAQTTTSEVEGRQFTEGKVTMFGNNVCLALIHVHI